MSEIKYRPDFPTQLIRMRSEGKSVKQSMAALGITKKTYYKYEKEYPEFGEASDLGDLLAEAYWEEIGQKGIKGILQKFNAPAWMYMMKCRFKEDWTEQNSQKIEMVDSVRKMSDSELSKTLEVLLAVKNKKTIPENGTPCQP